MFKLTIPSRELWDEKTEEFISIKGTKLLLEHSLLSVSKWEAKWKKPFLESDNKTRAEVLDYIRCMTITQNVDPRVYFSIPENKIREILLYIRDSQTATWFREDKTKNKKSSEKVTSELIYYWMVALNIPFECEKWHLNRLLTLIRICNIKNQPPKKMSKKESAAYRNSLNASRKARLHSKG